MNFRKNFFRESAVAEYTINQIMRVRGISKMLLYRFITRETAQVCVVVAYSFWIVILG